MGGGGLAGAKNTTFRSFGRVCLLLLAYWVLNLNSPGSRWNFSHAKGQCVAMLKFLDSKMTLSFLLRWNILQLQPMVLALLISNWKTRNGPCASVMTHYSMYSTIPFDSGVAHTFLKSGCTVLRNCPLWESCHAMPAYTVSHTTQAMAFDLRLI